MKIELIPVLEIGYNNQGVTVPEHYPYWKNQGAWHQYWKLSFEKAGFEDEFKPYLKGSPFFEPKHISHDNLKKLVADFTEVFREDDMKERELSNPFLGGYVLRVNGEDRFFPQCCGDLGDIAYWEKISTGTPSHYEGHPAPTISFESGTIIFDFAVKEHDEHFEPTPPDTRLEIDIQALRTAIDEAKLALKEFAKRIIAINLELNLQIERIDDLLIWENANHG
ncbi:MAG: hypothetical protein AB8F95_15315 [Bacteroidia bacterium]